MEVADTVEMTYFPAADIVHIGAVVEMMVLPFKSQKIVASCYYLNFPITNITYKNKKEKGVFIRRSS